MFFKRVARESLNVFYAHCHWLRGNIQILRPSRADLLSNEKLRKMNFDTWYATVAFKVLVLWSDFPSWYYLDYVEKNDNISVHTKTSSSWINSPLINVRMTSFQERQISRLL